MHRPCCLRHDAVLHPYTHTLSLPHTRADTSHRSLRQYTCKNGEEAVQIENDSPYGNAAAVYTQSGASAEFYTPKFRAAMIGVNIGIPVPRCVSCACSHPLLVSLAHSHPHTQLCSEPFSFGGLYSTASKYGDYDITGAPLATTHTHIHPFGTPSLVPPRTLMPLRRRRRHGVLHPPPQDHHQVARAHGRRAGHCAVQVGGSAPAPLPSASKNGEGALGRGA